MTRKSVLDKTDKISEKQIKTAMDGLKELKYEREQEAILVFIQWFKERGLNPKPQNYGFGQIAFFLDKERLLIDPPLGLIVYSSNFQNEAEYLAKIGNLKARPQSKVL